MTRQYGDVGAGGGYAPPLPQAPAPPTPDQLVPPLGQGAVQPYNGVQAPTISQPTVSQPVVPPQAGQAPDWISQLLQGWLGGTNMLGNQLAQTQPQDQGGPPFPWQRPAWMREGYGSDQAYQQDMARGY